MNAPITTPVDFHPNSRPVLYTKIGCPWCAEARAVLARQGIVYDERSVTTDAAAITDMLRVSGQTKAPVLDWSGEILADFGALELETFLVAQATGAFTAGGGS